MAAQLGAGRWERSDDGSEVRNGSRSRTVSTPAGDVEMKVPKLRKGSFSRTCSSCGAGSIGRCGAWS